jgi:hypothetical protein
MDIAIGVEQADALDRHADVFVLKYAQRLYGLDEAAVRRMGGPSVDYLPRINEHAIVRDPHGIAASALLFLGVPPLGEFTYHDIREFGGRALSVLATEQPRAREICLTLHGVGFGLDEVEAFRSEVAGVLDAINAGRVGSGLERVTFLERNERRAARMGRLLDDLLGQERFTSSHSPVGSPRSLQTAQRDLGMVGFDSQSRRHAFVAMPFALPFEDRFHFGIAPALRERGMLCERMDELSFTGDVVSMMRQRIESAQLVVADVTAANPNVYLEIGYAWACRRPTVILCEAGSEPLFDVRGHRHLKYQTILELKEKLTKELGELPF